MVDGIASTARVTLHQALHGYAEGHGQLATSVNLKPRDNKTLLILSDISGPGAPLDDAGYLTGYPLPDLGFYAFARTWPAPEMSRPGCVWTHTLLIDFADVPAVNSMTELVSAFRRPNGSAYDGFGKPIVLHLPAIQARIKESDAPAARKIVSALYAKPDAKVIAGRAATSDVDRLVTVLWSQQWPRLRRAFRFCTSAATDRSLSDTSFDLQFLPGNGQALRTRFPNVVDAEDAVEVGGWLDEAVADLVRPEPDGLREFLRRIGLDIPGGRNVFRNLCQLFILTRKFPSEADALEQAVQLLDIEFGDAPARAARATVAAAALPRAELLSDAGFEYLLNHLNVVEPSTFAASANVLGRAILHRSPAALGPMLKADDGMLRNFAEDTLRDASAPDLATAIKAAPAIALPILTRRAELAALPSLWSRDLRVENSAFEALRVRGLPSSVVIAMIKAGRTDLARQATKEAGALEVLQALSSVMWSEPFVRGECETWLREAAQPREVAQLLTGPQGQPRALLALIAHVTRPDDVPTTLARTLGFLLCIALTAPHPMLMKHICAPFCWPEALGASRVARLNLHKRPLSTSMPRPLPIGYPTKAGACLIRYFPGQFSGLIGTVVNGSALAWWTSSLTVVSTLGYLDSSSKVGHFSASHVPGRANISRP